MTHADLHQYVSPGAKQVVADRGRDFADTARRLAHWLSGKLPGASEIALSNLRYPIGAGTSNETILCEARWRESGGAVEQRLVFRLHPGNFQLFMEPAFEEQVKVLRLLEEKGWVRVAKLLWYEASNTVLGQPFFVMQHVPGKVPVTFPVYNAAGFLFDANPAERRRAWLSAMRQFIAMHRIPVEAVRFLHRPQYGASGFDDEFNYWTRALDWTAQGRTPPTQLAALEWLTAHRPPVPPDGLSWGDARIGNMIFDEQFEVAAVLDWEQASLGGPLQDLGWWLAFDTVSSACMGVKRLEGLGSREETIALWEEGTGLRAAHLDWYEVYAIYKAAVLAMRKARLEKRTLAPGNNPGNNLMSRRLCELLERAPPADME